MNELPTGTERLKSGPYLALEVKLSSGTVLEADAAYLLCLSAVLQSMSQTVGAHVE